MKKLGVLWSSFLFLLLMLSSCSSTQIVENDLVIEEEKSITIESFPAVGLNSPDRNVRSSFSADIVDNPLSISDQNVFGDNIVYQFNNTYPLYGKQNEVDYYVMLFNFEKTVLENAVIKQGDIIGKMKNEDMRMTIFCKTLDPFLVINCRNIPYHYGGFYWFEASFLFSNGSTDWLSFEPTPNIEEVLIDVAEHTIEELSSFTYYQLRTNFKTNLTEYPRTASAEEKQGMGAFEMVFYRRNGLMVYVNEIQVGDYKYFLCWQKGFLQYLTNEYTLGNDIWIYGSVAGYDVQSGCGYIFIRDFKLEPLEAMYESRIKTIEENI